MTVGGAFVYVWERGRSNDFDNVPKNMGKKNTRCQKIREIVMINKQQFCGTT